MTANSIRALVLSALLALPAWAGPLATDPAALPQFRGTSSFDAPDPLWPDRPDKHLLVDIDYAVYPPGAYPNDAIAGKDPSHGAEYVYAFQVFNLSASRSLTTVGLSLNHCSGANNLQADPLHAQTGGLSPSDFFLLPDSITIDFWDVPLPPGGVSVIILFTSQNGPTMTSAAIQDGGLTDQNLLPAPQTGPNIPADFDNDCDVDMEDYLHFNGCVTGPAIHTENPLCLDADLDGDGDVDQSDFGLFQRCFSGTDRPVNQAACLGL